MRTMRPSCRRSKLCEAWPATIVVFSAALQVSPLSRDIDFQINPSFVRRNMSTLPELSSARVGSSAPAGVAMSPQRFHDLP